MIPLKHVLKRGTQKKRVFSRVVTHDDLIHGFISNREALEVVLAAEENEKHPAIIREELPAIVSHWLQSPNDPPILLRKQIGKKWRQILQHHIGLSQGSPIDASFTRQVQPEIDFSGIPFPPPQKSKFKFMDLLAGI